MSTSVSHPPTQLTSAPGSHSLKALRAFAQHSCSSPHSYIRTLIVQIYYICQDLYRITKSDRKDYLLMCNPGIDILLIMYFFCLYDCCFIFFNPRFSAQPVTISVGLLEFVDAR